MKRLLFTLLIAFCGILSIQALNYKEARREAWFLSDKMAYELNLTPEQCDVVYEINLDYFLSIRRPSDCRGVYWRFRAEDLRYVLYDWQYRLFVSIDYFYYPIRWIRSNWYYPVCHHYHSSYYYFDRPVVCVSYHGSGWRHRSHHSVSPYHNRHFRANTGLRDRYSRGESGVYRPRHNSYDGKLTTPREPARDDRPSRDFNSANDRNNRNSWNDRDFRDRNSNSDGYRPSRHESVNGVRQGESRREAGKERPSRELNRSSRDRSGKERTETKNSSRTSREKTSSTSSRQKASSGGHERSPRELGTLRQL